MSATSRASRHTLHDLIRQRVFQIALGYPDTNDATRLRHDPAFKTACDHLPADPLGLASQPTLSRLDTGVTARDVVRLQRDLERAYVAELPADTTVVVLDLDATDDPTHGQQAFAFFNAHYDHHVLLPVLMFDGEGRLVSLRLRPGNAGAYRYTLPMVERVIRRLKARFPDVQVGVRGDGGFAAPRFLDGLERLDAELGGIDYLIVMPTNKVLERCRLPAMVQAWLQHRATGKAARVFTAFPYAAKSWSRRRHIVAKAEYLPRGLNPALRRHEPDGLPTGTGVRAGLLRPRPGRKPDQGPQERAGGRSAVLLGRRVANAFRLLLHAVAFKTP